MKNVLKLILILFLFINIVIVISGKSWLYKAVYITYLKGYTSSYIEDFVHFPANTIEVGLHQEWGVADNYNNEEFPDFIKEVNDSLETVAFLVIVNDSIRTEKYWQGYSSKTISNSFSISKSFVSTLIGVAIKEGEISNVNQKISDFLPKFSNKKEGELTIKNLLSMSSGLNWDENYYNPIGQTAQAYYGSDLKRLIMGLKTIEAPGKVFKYHSSCTQILTFILESATKKTISEYASEKLWKPMGAKHPALWNTDVKGGDEKGFCCINSNARDFARLGKLYLHYGNWNGNQILDSSYIKAATSNTNLIDINGNKNINYGYQFWLSQYKEMSIYYARGLWGQYIICVPEKNMIIVRLGKKYGNYLGGGHYDCFYNYIDAALEMHP